MKANLFILILCAGILGILGSLAYKKNLFKSSDITTELIGDGASIQIHGSENNKMCKKFQFIELQFKGESGEDLRIVTKCNANIANSELESFLIPFTHMFRFPPQTGEFTTQIDTKIYLSNHQKKWSKIWNLTSFRFFNSEENQFIVADKKLTLNLKDLLKVSESGL